MSLGVNPEIMWARGPDMVSLNTIMDRMLTIFTIRML